VTDVEIGDVGDDVVCRTSGVESNEESPERLDSILIRRSLGRHGATLRPPEIRESDKDLNQEIGRERVDLAGTGGSGVKRRNPVGAKDLLDR
jgi:hypothetical protein